MLMQLACPEEPSLLKKHTSDLPSSFYGQQCWEQTPLDTHQAMKIWPDLSPGGFVLSTAHYPALDSPLISHFMVVRPDALQPSCFSTLMLFNPHALQPSCFLTLMLFQPCTHFSKNQQEQSGYHRCPQPSCCHLPKETKRDGSIEAQNFSLHKNNDLLLLPI